MVTVFYLLPFGCKFFTNPNSNLFFYPNSNLSLLIVYSPSTSSSTSINKAKYFCAFIKRDKLRYLNTPLTVSLTKQIELLKFLNQLVYFDENNNNKQTNKTCYHWLNMQIVKFRDTRNLEIVVGSHEHPILPAFQS